MATKANDPKSTGMWFVGASYGGIDDQTSRFLSKGIWENGFDDKYLDEVRSMKPGERIAIKSSYTRKHGLPFDNREQSVSVMAIKAVGTITKNYNDGQRLKVDWTKVEPVREWYFYTNRVTIWHVLPGKWTTDSLIAFTVDGKSQDIEQFRNAPFWKERFGSAATDKRRFAWTKFYEAVADGLLAYRHKRSALVKGIRTISEEVDGLGYLTVDQYPDGRNGFVRDICPFTSMGLFNRGIKDSNRKAIAAKLAKFLGVREAVPETFEGIPVLNNLKSWYFPFEAVRDADHIDALWDVFAEGIAFADSNEDGDRTKFAKAFDNANGRRGVAWNLTFGLYWARPWAFLSLDRNSKDYVTEELGVPIGLHGPKRRCNSADYLEVMDALESRFQDTSYRVHSYPELSLAAWEHVGHTSEAPMSDDDELATDADVDDEIDHMGIGAGRGAAAAAPYTVDDILNDGCFLDRGGIQRMLEQLRVKKNLIIQGPPGTGKTWLARRLAFASVGHRNERRVRVVQFHPNLSYEDFVRGWRPVGEGKLSLANGAFMEAIDAASRDPSSAIVVVIEEINRGNPAQIFGEMLTLLEAGKRTPADAIELCYPDADGRRRPIHIPENLYVIGTMNLADRSLALVDLALRRRFAFVSLEPRFGAVWRNWIVAECNVDETLVAEIERRVMELNGQIAGDPTLGKQFRVGHSYVTPTRRLRTGGTREWFSDVIETEIGPLLDEYWFDKPDEAEKARGRLASGW